MIIIDYSQTIISNLMAEIGGRKDIDLEVNLLRHMVLNTIRSHHVKFKNDYGELVIACDNKKYWRKEIFPHYKANRKKAREESGYDWNMIFETINVLKAELKAVFPYRVIEVEGAEADDIIATLVKHSNGKPNLIISGDHDFIQLQKYPNVKQFSPIQKKFVTSELSPEKVVLEHIIKGDKGDGIPNVLTEDAAIVNGERQKPVQSKKLKEWLDDPTTMPNDDDFLRRYNRNKLLVDLSKIPDHIEEKILNIFDNYTINDRSMILNYFVEHKMKNMLESIEDF
jgi:hypothetical protein